MTGVHGWRDLRAVRYQILANFTGNLWTALLALAFVPIYIHFLGIDAFGLVGFYTTVLNVLSLVDLGVTPTINRELARHVALPSGQADARDLVRSFELPYWGIGVVLGGGLAASSGLLATSWIQSDRLSPDEVRRAVAIMGLAIAWQWPLTFYQGGLMGLQRPLLLQAVNTSAATIRGVGAIVVLALVSPTITAFFVWHAVSAAAQTLVAALCLWRALPPAERKPVFRAALLRERWRFSVGIGATSAVSLLLTQMDKLVLSKVVSLQLFGYYVLAGTVADALYKLITPVSATLFPKFSALVARAESSQLTALYHRSCQLVSAVVVPAAFALAVFSRELIALWTRNPQLVDGAAPIVRVLVIGTAMNGLMSLPYAAQLAHGWVRLGLMVNLAALLVMTPITVLLATRFGGVGAAFAWVMLNASYLLIAVPLMHRRILRGQLRRWYFVDVLLPSIAGIAVIAAGAWLLPPHAPRWTQIAIIGGTCAAAAAAAVAAAPDLRRWTLALVPRRTPAATPDASAGDRR